MRVTIASRRSDLARIQAYQVGDTLRAANPQLEINYSFHESLGDKNLERPLWQMPEKGVFTQDFREGLLHREFDLVVHSWKDLAIEDDPETEVIATLPRADARDLLLVPQSRWNAVERTGVMTILTSSPRRAHNLDSFLRIALPANLSRLEFINVRGNVPTRVRKLLQSDVDGLIVAKAAIDRLLEASQSELAATQKDLREALSQCRWMVLPLRENPSAPAQGALAVEISRDRADIRELLAPLNCADAFSAVLSEREILRSYGGGCHQKIGVSVLRRPFGEITLLRGLTDNGELLDRCTLRSAKPRPPKIVRDEMWPLNPSDADWFVREVIQVDSLSPWERARVREPADVPTPSLQSSPKGRRSENRIALWIAKADALPDHWKIEADKIVWASGVQTWKRLASRGVWVNGCAESLGEQESPGIETLAGAAVDWLKLTHEGGYTDGEMHALATYRLVPRDETVDLSGRKYFFWKSGSSFEHALLQNSWLKDMTHFCGPGNTQKILQRHGLEPHVFLDHAHWLEEMSQ
ncbi:MAG TPA: hydroxymethylbilane synthase [Pyrinomonadaceae bacterium]|nr:hydroxymethylbilane synthase [Pyrinomonadaceae bacterium]